MSGYKTLHVLPDDPNDPASVEQAKAIEAKWAAVNNQGNAMLNFLRSQGHEVTVVTRPDGTNCTTIRTPDGHVHVLDLRLP